MKLLDKPYTREEKEDTLRSLQGCICRICISDDVEEIVRMLGFANNYLSMLAYSRTKQIKEEERVELKNE